MELVSLSTVVVVGTAVAACITDVRTFRVYNALTVPVMVGGLAYSAAQSGFSGLSSSFLGVLVGFLVLIVPYAVGAMGAGDVKLLSAFGAWLGVSATAQVALIACLCTGLYALAILWLRGGLSEAILNVQISWLRMQTLGRHLASDDEALSIQEIRQLPDYRKRLIPFSVMLAIGVITTLVIGTIL